MKDLVYFILLIIITLLLLLVVFQQKNTNKRVSVIAEQLQIDIINIE